MFREPFYCFSSRKNMSFELSEYISVDLNKFTCRICLQNGEICNSFFDTIYYNDENKELRELYQLVTKVEICDGDVKPTQICEECTGKLITAYELVLNAERSEQILSSYISHSNDDHLEYKVDTQTLGTITETLAEHESPLDDECVTNDTEMKEEIGFEADVNEEIEVEYGKQCEDLEILDEFEFVLQKEPQETAEAIKGDVVEPIIKNEESRVSGKKTKESTSVRNAIGSRLNLKSNNRSQRYECPVCHRSFAKFETYERHVESVHTYAPREEIASKQTLNESSVECPFCPRVFMHRNDLQRHLIAIHPKEKDLNGDNIEQSLKTPHKRKYNHGLCPHCGQVFPTASLIIHIRRHLGVNPYKCDQCEKAFPRKQDLIIHQRQHSGERPHVCTVCGKSFVRPNKLSRHMRIHLGIRPYKCEECGKCFSQSNDLTIHLRRHSGEKPYVCGICSDAFISGTALKTHRKAKNHFEPDRQDADPYANWRVNSRPYAQAKKAPPMLGND